MTAYAVIETGGKQYKVTRDDIVKIEKIPGNVGEIVEFKAVLFLNTGDDVLTEEKDLSDALVKGKIIAQEKDRKIVVFKFKRRKNYKRKQGHRQHITRVLIKEIFFKDKLLTPEVKKEKKPKKVEEKPEVVEEKVIPEKKEAKVKKKLAAKKVEKKKDAKKSPVKDAKAKKKATVKKGTKKTEKKKVTKKPEDTKASKLKSKDEVGKDEGKDQGKTKKRSSKPKEKKIEDSSDVKGSDEKGKDKVK